MNSSRRLRLFLAATTAALLAACVSTAPVLDPATGTATLRDKSIVIVSVSHDQLAGSGAHTLFFMDLGADAVRLPTTQVLFTDPDISNDFKPEIGHVYVLQVKPGHHSISSWSMMFGTRNAEAPSGIVPLDFDVSAGEVLYLGNLHVAAFEGRRRFGLKTIAGVAAVVQDKSARDLPIAVAANPALAGRVRMALLPLGPWGRAPHVPDMGAPGN